MITHWSTLLIALLLFFNLLAEGSTFADDANALQALSQYWPSTITTNLGWTNNDPCGSEWVGIQCDMSNPQRVTSIILTGIGIPGSLASDIGLLTAVETIDLSYNNLTGPIPSQLGQLAALGMLKLQANYFTGTIPPAIGQLQNLTYLALNQNNLRGPIPHEVGLLKNLYWLDLSYNQLNGPLPYSSDGNTVNAGLDNLTAAEHFHLNNNNIGGSIPGAICHSTMILIHLLLDSNQLTGIIPPEIGLCSNLLIVKLSNNQLTGTVPSEFGNLSNLTELQLSQNQLSGALPNLSTLGQLQVLELSNNSYAVEFPSWVTLLQMLTDLSMQRVIVDGEIPNNLFQLPYLTSVRLDDNLLSGNLSVDGASSSLLLVSLENNQITSLNPGLYRQTLRLQGNPVCINSSTLSSDVCLAAPTSPPPSYEQNSCSITCPSGYMVNPYDCSCAIPYQGFLTYRAPSFTTLSNTSRIQSVVPTLASALSINQNQIEISSAVFNSQNQLIIGILIFPNGSPLWNLDDIMKISYIIGKGVSPPAFGPSMFTPASYPIDFSTQNSGNWFTTKAKIGIGVGAAVLVLIILMVCIYAFWQKCRADTACETSRSFPGSWTTSRQDSGAAPTPKGIRRFSLDELKKATNNFNESNEIGLGGYGKVYKGILLSGQQVAIKRAQENSMQGAVEFKNEIELLSTVHHKNVVTLIGFCFEKKEQMLVYEYMASGTLRDNLQGNRAGAQLDWHQRLLIAVGTARGIAYLHELVNPPIIHRDIKSSNILLDDKKLAKVADFGLSKFGPNEGDMKQHITTQVKGTVGYLDPEYYLSQQLTEKSDVYSFGVLMLELLTARPPIVRGKYVVREVKTATSQGGLRALHPLLDSRLKVEEMVELNDYVSIALACVEEAAASRPTMGEVVRRLEAMTGHEYPGSGSSQLYVDKTRTPKHPYAVDSEYLQGSNDTSDLSFSDSMPQSK